MNIAKSTYYHKTFKEEKQRTRDFELRDSIESIHLEFPGYGYRRIREHLLRQGIRVNNKRIRRVMRTYSLFSCLKKMFKQRGQTLGRRLVFPNLIRGKLLTKPNQVWATDITYIKLLREYIYVSAVIDVYTRKIVGWAISQDLSHKFCLQALDLAVKKYKPPEGIIHHSDRGVQYCCEAYVDYLEQHHFKISMSKAGTPEENAFIEAFFKTMKREEVYVKQYETIKDVVKNLPRFIDEIYNERRLHSALGYKSPSEFESEVMNLKPANRPVQKIWGYAV
jgi:transposase InsO family protein